MGGPGLDEPALLAAADSAVLREAGGACPRRRSAGSLRAGEQCHGDGLVPAAGYRGYGNLLPEGASQVLASPTGIGSASGASCDLHWPACRRIRRALQKLWLRGAAMRSAVAFRETAEFQRGRTGERLVAELLQSRGWYVIPSYDYSGEDGDKPPRLQGLREAFPVPDLAIARDGIRSWAGVKTKAEIGRAHV